MSQMIVTEVQTTFSPEELQEVSGLPAEIFNEIKDLGALDEFLDHGRYVSRSFLVIRKAARLRRTFDLQSDALALLIHYMAKPMRSRIKSDITSLGTSILTCKRNR